MIVAGFVNAKGDRVPPSVSASPCQASCEIWHDPEPSGPVPERESAGPGVIPTAGRDGTNGEVAEIAVPTVSPATETARPAAAIARMAGTGRRLLLMLSFP